MRPSWYVYGATITPFIFPCFSIAQLATYYSLDTSGNQLGLTVPCPPGEWYRTLTNMFAHSSGFHLWSNVLSTLVIGIALEMRNGFLRVAPIWYVSAVLGTLLQGLISPRPVVILGSSGGVYAILAAFVAELVMNWSELALRWFYVVLVLLVLALELTVVSTVPQSNIAYGAHFGGAAYGFTIGLCLVKNWRWKRHEYCVFFVAFIVAIVVTVVVVALTPRLFVQA